MRKAGAGISLTRAVGCWGRGCQRALVPCQLPSVHTDAQAGLTHTAWGPARPRLTQGLYLGSTESVPRRCGLQLSHSNPLPGQNLNTLSLEITETQRPARPGWPEELAQLPLFRRSWGNKRSCTCERGMCTGRSKCRTAQGHFP